MITGKLDSLNLNTSKPSSNAKLEAAPIEQGFNGVLENLSLATQNLDNSKSPNTVSEDVLKTLTENINNSENLNLASQENADQVLTEEAMMNPLLMNMLSQQLPQAPKLTPEAGTAEAMMAAAKTQTAQVELKSQGVIDQTAVNDQLLATAEEIQNLDTKSIDSEKAAIQKAAAEILPASVETKPVAQEGTIAPELNGKNFSLEGFNLVKPQKFELTAPQAEVADVPQMETSGLDNNLLPVTGVDKDSAKSQGDFRDSSKDFNQDNSALMAQDGSGQPTIKEKVSSNFNQTLEAQSKADALPKATTDQIVTHARTVVSQGGASEMNIKLNPEGMGPVDLKVAVKNGMVNIEINTQNAKAKKMFESGIADIRGALETQNLRMDSLKVHMTEKPADGQMNSNNGGQQMSDKDFARQFMGQFRDERHGFRNQTMTNAFEKFRGVSKENSAVGLRPSGYSRSANSSSRLNVVG